MNYQKKGKKLLKNVRIIYKMKAVIMAAGKGTRMLPLTKETHKKVLESVEKYRKESQWCIKKF